MFHNRAWRNLVIPGMLLFLVLSIALVCSGRAEERTQLRVLTYNIHHGEAMDGKFDYGRLAKLITDIDPDIVALQEVDRKTERANGVDQPARQINFRYPAEGGPPIILAGDLNSRKGSPTMEALLAERWIDATRPISKIDYILLRLGDLWKVLEMKEIDEPVVSDHNPVVAVLEWLGEGNK